jgi:hypothetical protein
MPRKVVELKAPALVQLVQDIKALNVALNAGEGVIKLKCRCGAPILPPTPVLPNLRDRQRGHLKSRIERHLRSNHRLSKQTVHVVLNESFAAGRA